MIITARPWSLSRRTRSRTIRVWATPSAAVGSSIITSLAFHITALATATASPGSALGSSRWRGEQGRVEVWYATLTDRHTGAGVWIHHETVAPKGERAPYAHGWAAVFQPGLAPVVERFGPLLNEHPLRRELIAMLVANDVVNSQGITFVSRVVTETGADAADVTRAYRIARDVTGAVERWEEIEALVGTLEPALLDDLMSDV